MTERLLQYIWQFQYYNSNELVTVDGERLTIIHPGTYNTCQGPDFTEGRIMIGDDLWVGNIELHIQSSDWRRHFHGDDRNYHNVILHVVWVNDEDRLNRRFPTLVLGDRVPKVLLQQYQAWMTGNDFIPCQASAAAVSPLIWLAWTERMIVERLERKAAGVLSLLEKNNHHWEEVSWWLIARNFGLYVNADAFGEVAMSVPFNVLAKHRGQIHQIEAVLFGQARLLEKEFSDRYVRMLKKEYGFLQAKYDLQAIHLPIHFLRMRPACFPTVRMAQLAMFIHSAENIFSAIVGADELKDVKEMFCVTANDYWHYRFRFDEEAPYQPKSAGRGMINSIVVNAVIVLLYAYGKHHREERYQQRAIGWMMELAAENNSVISKFRGIGLKVKNAGDSQALIELKTQYCDQRRCLDCAIGAAIMKGI